MLLFSVRFVHHRIVSTLPVYSKLANHQCVSGTNHEFPVPNGHLDGDRTECDGAKEMAAAFRYEEVLHLTENDGD